MPTTIVGVLSVNQAARRRLVTPKNVVVYFVRDILGRNGVDTYPIKAYRSGRQHDHA